VTEDMTTDEFLDSLRNATGLNKLVRRYYALRRGLINAPGNARCAYQRLTRGWDDKSVWDVRDHLARTLGAQLVRMADVAHGYPAGIDIRFVPDVPEDDEALADWVAELRTHGEALLAYHVGHDDIAWDDRGEFALPAQAALRWVAEHLDDLWD
jgi:hypothetical protein